ncbi:MAG: glycosyltransferase family 39 protein [Dehalococcoidales bacterium]|nr:glycosyltransferase family 39 protein [Dehalococcoidales bacterium]
MTGAYQTPEPFSANLTREFVTVPPDKPNLLKRVLHWEYLLLSILVALLLVMHFSLVYQQYHPFYLFGEVGGPYGFLSPDQTIFDEKHYVENARSILNGEGDLRGEHPPLGKVLILAGMKIFGDNPLGWRFFPILMGVAGIVFFYLTCRRLNMGMWAAYLATIFLAFENLTFVQSQVAMLDVFMLPLMMAAFWLYLRHNYLLAGVLIGLTALVKITGVLILPAILLHWMFFRRDGDWKFLGLLFLAAISFLALLSGLEYFTAGHFTNPVTRISSMLSGMSSLTFETATHPNMSRPWEWILNVDYLPFAYVPHYVGTISLTLWWFIIPAIIYMIYRSCKGNEASRFALLWFFGTYILWIPLSLLTDRVSFVYYFYPSVGAICIGLGLAFNKLVETWQYGTGKIKRGTSLGIVIAFIVLTLAVFLLLSPFTNWWMYPIPTS